MIFPCERVKWPRFDMKKNNIEFIHVKELFVKKCTHLK